MGPQELPVSQARGEGRLGEFASVCKVNQGKELRGMASWPVTSAESRREPRAALKLRLALMVGALAAIGLQAVLFPLMATRLVKAPPASVIKPGHLSLYAPQPESSVYLSNR